MKKKDDISEVKFTGGEVISQLSAQHLLTIDKTDVPGVGWHTSVLLLLSPDLTTQVVLW